MKNIINEDDYLQLTQRIKNLTAINQRQWGTMTVTQMLEHCCVQLQLALGQTKAVRSGPWIFHTWLGKKIALSAIPWSRGMKSPAQMIVPNADATAFTAAQQELLWLLEKAQPATVLHPHPFFENLSRKEWGRLIWKHTGHHLKQFSA
jgi:hypothetical protein